MMQTRLHLTEDDEFVHSRYFIEDNMLYEIWKSYGKFQRNTDADSRISWDFLRGNKYHWGP